MDNATILNNVKIILGLDVEEEGLLNVLINKAIADIKIECNNDFKDGFPAEMSNIVEDLVIYRYNKRGAEGFQSENRGDVSITYTNTIPDDILRKLYKYRKVRVF